MHLITAQKVGGLNPSEVTSIAHCGFKKIMNKIIQLLFLLLIVIIFSFIGYYMTNGFFGAILGSFTGLILVNAIYSIINYKKKKFPLRATSILLIITAIAWFFLIIN